MSRIPQAARPRAGLTCLFAALVLVASACTTPPQAPPRVGGAGDDEPGTEPDIIAKPSGIRHSPHAELFAEAEAALDGGDWMAADLALPRAADSSVDAEFSAYEDYVRARIAWQRGDLDAMSTHLQGLREPALSDELALKILDLQRRRARLETRHRVHARLSIRMLEHLPPDHPDADTIADATWRSLRHMTDAALRKAGANAGTRHAAGWFGAARLAAGDIDQWRARHPGHPAARFLPAQDDARTISRVALLLPLGGRIADAAAAVRNGFIEHYFEERGAGGVGWDIIVLDTTAYASARAAYNAAIDNGAQLVVGPLTKAAVTHLLTAEILPVPVIALNRSESGSPAGARSLQFALAPEDEAAQIAELAFADGHRRALLVRPAGAWGSKMARALRQRWESFGGKVAATATFDSRETHSSSLSAALDLDASRQRATSLRRQLAQSIETSGRRREDIDAVFLVVPSAADARSLMPLLAYHYSGSLPAYATSSANSEENDDPENDLNGLQLVEMPAILNKSGDQRAATLRGDDYARLAALGADACRLASQGVQGFFRGNPLLRGETGFLSINEQDQIERDLQPAVFDRGALRPR